MIAPNENANIRPGESAVQFKERGERVLAEAKALSEGIGGNLTGLNRWMAIASPTMTWMQSLYFSIERMRRGQDGAGTPDSNRFVI